MRKVWFITGANRGLGLGIAQAVLAAGHAVVATARNVDDLKKKLTGEPSSLFCLPLDITDAAQIKTAVQGAVDTFSRIDVLVNNAGYGQLGWFENTSDEQVSRQFETNVFGTMNVTRAILPVMRARRSGHVFTISSAAGMISVAGSSTYSASKFAVEGWMEGLANEIAPLGIHATIVAPGFFKTDFLDPTSVSYGTNDIPEYAESIKAFNDFHDQMNHQQVGDPAKLGAALITLSDWAEPPVRYAAGSDSLGGVHAKIDIMLKQAELLAPLSASTDSAAT